MRYISLNFTRSANPALGMPINLIGAYPRWTGKRVGYWLACLLASLCLSVTGCSKPLPEQALRESIGKLEQAALKKDSSEFFEFFAEDFSGSDGLDRESFRRYVQLVWLQNKDIGVQMGPLDVKLMDDRATVDFTVALSGGQGLLPDRGQIYQVQTGWRREGDDWRLISATWKPVL